MTPAEVGNDCRRALRHGGLDRGLAIAKRLGPMNLKTAIQTAKHAKYAKGKELNQNAHSPVG